MPDLSAIPVGPLQRASNASLFQPKDLKVQFLRLRLVRHIQADETGATLLRLIESKDPLDPKFKPAKAIWDSWQKEHWHEDKNGFVRQFLLSALRLDLAEGALDEEGQRGSPKLAAVIKSFERETNPNDPAKAKLDPQRELNTILKKK